MKLYRCREAVYCYGSDLFIDPKVEVYTDSFSVIKETPCGYWINDWNYKRKWVSKTSRKRYAYPTIEEAIVSFRKRKERQAHLLTINLAIAKAALKVESKDFHEGGQC